MEPTQPNRLVPTLVGFQSLLIAFSSSCPQATDPQFTRAWFHINERWRHLNLLLLRIEEDIGLLKRARRGDIEHRELETLLAAPSLDIEVLYVVLRSLLDSIATLTPCFYPKQGSRLTRRSFKEQLNWYRKYPDFDPAMTDYAQRNTGWFADLRETRDDLIHHNFDVFTSNSGAETAQGEIPVQYGIVTESGLKGAPEEIEAGVRSMLCSLLAFLDFYRSHFDKRLRDDWPPYARLGTLSTQGAVQGLESLKRWSE